MMNEREKTNKGYLDLFSRTIIARNRRYYLDVKSSENNLVLTLTESKRKFNNRNGKFYYERNRVIVFSEDMDNFMNSFREVEKFLKDYLKRHPDISNFPSPPNAFGSKDSP
ncbi:MAG TPA: DUF3276 family protein [Bacteroidales bacterium]|jgi:hypothetical protein|nr:DUF3276 family protein [Bacteroidales bacterium]HNU20823.1 DUF3276 family protein [Bacteroidales bacterium]HNV16443.1 DUF3276 family protein [Bacteroidales bacterium]HNZ78542.1 DUF3276 family protein [Bacteroidales bacterium]HOC14729.1 DUF3276 family protein [Bacteroidales bacterium]